MYKFETDRPLKAFVDVVVDGVLLIKGLRIMKGERGLFVGMPREQAKDTKWYETIRCLTPEFRDKLQSTIISVYNDEEGEEEEEVHPWLGGDDDRWEV
jgi:stage V sporulation protein G